MPTSAATAILDCQTAAPHARVAVFAGPEVTVRQLGPAVQPWVAAITNPSHPVRAADDVARAILAYKGGGVRGWGWMLVAAVGAMRRELVDSSRRTRSSLVFRSRSAASPSRRINLGGTNGQSRRRLRV